MSGSEQGEFCHGCKARINSEDSIAYSFAARLWHVACFKCATCQRIMETDEKLLLLSDGRPVCRDCPYRCCMCHRSVVGQSIHKDDIAIYEGPPSIGDTYILYATRLIRIWCNTCRLPDQPRLPPELFRRIILFSLPSPSPSDQPFDERRFVLSQLSHVSRLFRTIAQRELFMDPLIYYWGQKENFLRAVEGRSELGEATTSLELGPSDGGEMVAASRFELARFVAALPSLRSLSISGLVDVDIHLLGAAANTNHLRRLAIHNCHLPPTIFNSHPLFNIRELYLIGHPFGSESLPPVLSPVQLATYFPFLSSLTLVTEDLGRPSSPFIWQFLASLLPQLRVLCLVGPPPLSLPEHEDGWGERATSLKFLDVRISSLATVLPLFTRPIRFLHVSPNTIPNDPTPIPFNERLAKLFRAKVEEGSLVPGWSTLFMPAVLREDENPKGVARACEELGLEMRENLKLREDDTRTRAPFLSREVWKVVGEPKEELVDSSRS